MGSGDSNPLTKYVIPGLETVGGAVSEFFAPGNPIGISLIGSGVGSLAGGAAGGPQGQSLGGGIGGLLGGLGGGGALGGSLGMTGVSDSSIADMIGSVNPGAGTEAGIADSGASGGAGKGTGGLSSLMGSTGSGASSLDSFGSLLGPVAGLLKPTQQAPQLPQLNNKGSQQQALPITPAPQPVQSLLKPPGGKDSSDQLKMLLKLLTKGS